MFIPRWIQAHIHEAGAEGIDVFYEPPGHGWVNEHKLKRIQARLYEAFGSVQSAMERLDQVIRVNISVLQTRIVYSGAGGGGERESRGGSGLV